MSAYVVVHATPKDAEKMKAYSAAAAPTVENHGGEFVARGPSETLSGENPHEAMIIIRFPDRATAQRWYTSKEYQAAVPVRTEAMDSIFVLGGE